MPAANQALLIELDDTKIYSLLTDATGAAATYGTAVDIPNVVELTVKLEVKTATVDGDGKRKGRFTKITHISGKVKFNSVPLDVLQAIVGGTLTSSGTTPNQKSTWAFKGGEVAGYFKIAGRWQHAEGIDGKVTGAQVTVFKAKITSAPPLVANGEYASIEVEIEGVAPNGTSNMGEVVFEETQTALS